MLRKDCLVLISYGEAFEFKKVKWRIISPTYYFVNKKTNY